MRYGIIDIGSNTIRAVVYEVNEEGFKEVINEKEYAEIISFVEDGALSDEGIEKLCVTLAHLQNLCHVLECKEIFSFATSSLRQISNQQMVLDQVLAETGVAIEVISGCDEAYFDYVGLKDSVKLTEAVGFDLGGGSGQIFYYKNDQLMRSASHSIGCLRLYNACVKGVFPTSKERSELIKVVKGYLKEDGAYLAYKPEVIYAMGGTARACAKLHRKLIGAEQSGSQYWLTFAELEQLDQVITDMGLNGIKIINRIIPERLCTIIPGLIAIRVIMKHVGAKKICIIKQGIREGYLIENVLNRKDDQGHEPRKKRYICQ